MSESMHVDPKRLRGFAELLESTITDYRRALETLDGRLSRLGATWRDQEFQAFANEVKRTRSTLEEFIREATVARRHLLEDADRAEQYQRVANQG